MRAVIVLLVVAAMSAAHADILTRALDVAGGGGGGGSGSGSADEFQDLIQWAGEPEPIDLPQLLQIAVRQAPALRNARLDIKIAEAQITETLARKDWQLQLRGTGSKTLSAFAGLAFSSDIYGSSLDLSRALPTGGTIDLHGDTTYSKFKSTGPFGNQEYWQDNVSVGLTQPLLRGRGMWMYDASQEKAELTRDASVLARRSAAIQTVENVLSAYWDLVLAEREVAITQGSLDLARERLRVTEIGVRGGKTAQAEVPAVEQTIATREQDLLNGELGVLDASIALRRAAGMPIGGSALGLRVATDLGIRDDDVDLKSLVQRAEQASPELAELDKQAQGATIDIEVNDNGLLPRLDAALEVGPTAQRNSFHDTASDLVGLKELAINGSLTYQMSLGRHDVIGRSRELHEQREKIKVNAFDVQEQVAQAMTRAVAELEVAKRRVVLAQRAIELAKQNIRIETDRFNLGTRTNFDVLTRQEELRQAELSEAQAEVDWHKAEISVQALTGDILPQFGITVE